MVFYPVRTPQVVVGGRKRRGRWGRNASVSQLRRDRSNGVYQIRQTSNGVKVGGFELLPHTADIRMKVWGKTLEGLFRNALRGVASYLKEGILELVKKGGVERKEIRVEAADINSLLVDFLSESVSQSDIYNLIFVDAVFKNFGENFLEGEILGVKADGFDKDIKAVSYQDVDIKRNPNTGFYETVLVFDI